MEVAWKPHSRAVPCRTGTGSRWSPGLRQPVRRTAHLAVQHGAALCGAGAVAALVGLRIGARLDWDDALLTVGAATAWILTRYGVATLIGQWTYGGRIPRRAQRWRVELL